MVSPTVESVTPSSGAATTDAVVDYPADVDAGDTLICIITCDDDQVFTFPNEGVDWTTIFHEDAGNSGPTLAAAWRKAAGTEGGGSITVTINQAEEYAAYMIRISGAMDPTVTAPEATAAAGGNSNTPQPIIITPGGGQDDYLWIAAEGNDDDDATTGWPANMADNNVSQLGATGCNLGIATEQSNALDFTPGNFTIAAAETWECVTIAVYPESLSSGSEDLLGIFKAQRSSSAELLGIFDVRHDGSEDLLGIFKISKPGSEDLLGIFDARRDGSEDLLGEFVVRQWRANLLGVFRVRCPQLMGDNWQRKMWYDGTYYWRARYEPVAQEFIFEYIAEDGLEGNSWAENENAAIDASGFVNADFTVRGGADGIPTTIHYSDGVDCWVAESDEAGIVTWAWENLTKVFDGVPNDWYRMPNLCLDQQGAPKLWVTAIFYDQSEGKYWVKARRQTNSGVLAGWDVASDISNVNNTNWIYGASIRSMGADAGVHVMIVYKEGDDLNSRYFDGDWDDAIENIDVTALVGKNQWDFEHGMALPKMGHVIYVDADGSVQWQERAAGVAAAWGGKVEIEAAHGHTHVGLGLVEHGSGYVWAMWACEEDVHIDYKLHDCDAHTWWPPAAAAANIFDVTTDAVITTSTIGQIQTPDQQPAGSGVIVTWIGETAGSTPCEPGWGLIVAPAQEDLYCLFDVGQDSEGLLASFDGQVSVNLLGVFDIRRDGLEDLLGIFSIRRDGSAELLGIFDGQASVNLLGIFTVRRPEEAELLGIFSARRDASEDLLGVFKISQPGSAELLGVFEARRDGSQELLGIFSARRDGSEDLLGVFKISRPGSAELLAIFEGQASQSLLGIFEARRDGSAELLGVFKISQPGSAELLGVFEARHDGSAELLGIFTIGGVDSEDLLGIFDIRRDGLEDLLGIFSIRRDGSAELLGIFDGQASVNLLGIFSARRDGSEDLLGIFSARRDASEDLLGIFNIRRDGSEDLLGIFSSRWTASANLLGVFSLGVTSGSAELLGVFGIRQIGSEDLLGIFNAGGAGSEDLLGIFESGQGSEDLLAGFISVQAGSQDLFSETCIHTPRVAQDLDDSTWVEYDAGGLLDHDCNWSWWNDVRRDTQNTAHMKTVTGGLGSDFFHEFTLNMYAIQAAVPGVLERICPWAAHLEMTSQDYYGQDDFKIAALVVLAILDEPNEYQLRLIEKGGDSDTMLTHWVNFQDRYIVIYKQGTSLIANVYQDAAHTILEDSAEITLSGDLDFLYVSMPMSWGVAGAGTSSGLVDPIFGSMENLLCGFSIRRTGTPAELLGIFDSGQGSAELLGVFNIARVGSANLPAEFNARKEDAEDLLSIFRVRCSRRFGGNWQRKMWHDGAYYWRARYCPTHDRLEFEYIAEAGLAGNVWTENVAARINAAGFTGIDADFTVRGAGEGIPTTIHYSDGVDTWIAESDETSVLGWAWDNLTKVFDGTPNDWYRRVNLAANRTTPIPRLWAVAVFYDDLPDGKQWVKASRQSIGGDITGWDGEVDVSNVANTSTIYGCSVRSMGDAGLAKDDMIHVYKEGIIIRSRYYDGDWDDPIEDVDITTLAGRAAWDLEHVEMLNGDEMAHFIYVDADGSVQWRERDAGPASVWSAASQLEAAHADHFGVGIVDHGAGWSWCVWVHGDVLEYRLHVCLPEFWYPLLANPALTFDPATDAVITTSTIEQPQTPDAIHAGDAVPICWIGQTAPGTPCGLGWGILRGAAEEDLPCEFIIRHAASQDLAASFDGQVSVNLLGVFVIRQIGSEDLLAEFESGQGSEVLLGVLVVRHSASVELHGAFDGQATASLPGEFSARRSTQKVLPAEFVIRQTSEELPGQFISRPAGSANLLGIMNIVHAVDLDALFEVQHIDSAELLGVMVSQHEGFQNLSAKFLVNNADASNLLAGFILRHSFTGTGVIIARDPHALFNYNADVGTGFLSSPGSGGSDKQHKVAGEGSHAFRVKYIADRYDYISFGWKYRYPLLPGNTLDLRGGFLVNQLPTVAEGLRDYTRAKGWQVYVAGGLGASGYNAEVVPKTDGTIDLFARASSTSATLVSLVTYRTWKPTIGNPVTMIWEVTADAAVVGASEYNTQTLGALCLNEQPFYPYDAISLMYDAETGADLLSFMTDVGGQSEYTVLTGSWDPEVKHVYKIVWSTTDVKLYVDDVLKATHAVRVPDIELHFALAIQSVNDSPPPDVTETTLTFHSFSPL